MSSNVDMNIFLYSRFFRGRKHDNAIVRENTSSVDDNVGELNLNHDARGWTRPREPESDGETLSDHRQDGNVAIGGICKL